MDIDDIKIVQQLGELVASVRYINNSLDDVHRQLDAIYTRLTRLETTLSAHLNERETRGGGKAGGGSENYCNTANTEHTSNNSNNSKYQATQKQQQQTAQPKPAHKFTLLKLAALIPIVVPIAVFIVLVVVPLINSLANQ